MVILIIKKQKTKLSIIWYIYQVILLSDINYNLKIENVGISLICII